MFNLYKYLSVHYANSKTVKQMIDILTLKQ